MGCVIYNVESDYSDGCDHPRDVFFECGVCGRLHKVTVGCGKRFEYFCPTCSKRWRSKTFVKYFKAVNCMHDPKFLTLTLKKQQGRMTERLLELWGMKKKLFKYLSRLGYKIPSWVGVIEPPNHVHLIIDSRYIPYDIIRDLWRSVTKDSYIIDIRQVSKNDPKAIAGYITKYLSKAANWTGINLDLLAGFHLIGSWHLPPAPPRSPMCPCGVSCLHSIPEEGYYVLRRFYDRNVSSVAMRFYLTDEELAAHGIM